MNNFYKFYRFDTNLTVYLFQFLILIRQKIELISVNRYMHKLNRPFEIVWMCVWYSDEKTAEVLNASNGETSSSFLIILLFCLIGPFELKMIFYMFFSISGNLIGKKTILCKNISVFLENSNVFWNLIVLFGQKSKKSGVYHAMQW